MKNKRYYKTIIIGAGASGLMCANFLEKDFCILEGNSKPGVKLKITGNGRCNILNKKDSFSLIEHVSSNPKFMLNSLNNFGAFEIADYFINELTLPLKAEGDDRMYPLSERSQDVINSLTYHIEDHIIYDYVVQSITYDDGLYSISNNDSTYTCKNLILATGGQSYPLTGSTGFGYKIAKQFGHKIKPSSAVGVALNIDMPHKELNNLSGVQVSSAKVKYKKTVVQGDILFTHFGLSGPVIHNISHYLKYKDDVLKVDISHCEIPKRLAKYLKDNNLDANNLEFKVLSNQGLNKAVVTRGGIEVKNIDSKTFESKLQPNLFFIGETIDVDAKTGGYNLTLCWSMGKTCADYINTFS